VKKAPSLQLLLPRLPHPGAIIQWLTQSERLPTVVQAAEEKRTPPGKIESSHKLPVRKKRKNVVQEEEDSFTENDINSFSLEDMELEVDIEKMFPTIDQ
jgi:hypothetical protein